MKASGGVSPVSVVVTCYNQARFVDQCLGSIAAQTRPPMELIVVDDASTDSSVRALDDSLDRHGLDATRLYRDVNRGVCASFNEALAIASAPFIAFIAADDWMLDHRIEAQVKFLSEAPQDVTVVSSDLLIANEQGELIGERYSDRFDDYPPEIEDPLWRLLFGSNWVAAPAAMMRTDVVRSLGGWDERLLYEDLDMWARVVAAGGKISVLEEALVVYRQVSTSLSRTVLQRGERVRVSELLLRSKHVGRRTDLDSILIPHLHHEAVSLLKAGVEPELLAPVLLRVARSNPSASSIYWAVRSHLRVAMNQARRW